jgi:hypothetical protein
MLMLSLKLTISPVGSTSVAERPKDMGHADLFISKGEEVAAVLAKIAALLDRPATGPQDR